MTDQQKDKIFQVIRAEDGTRSEPFKATKSELFEILNKEMENGPKKEDLILHVLTIDAKHSEIPQSPLITVGRFLAMYDSSQLEEKENA